MNTHDSPLKYAHARYRHPVDLDAPLPKERPEIDDNTSKFREIVIAEPERRVTLPATDDKLSKIAGNLRRLEYGPMMDLAGALAKLLATSPSPLSDCTIAAAIHAWAKGHGLE